MPALGDARFHRHAHLDRIGKHLLPVCGGLRFEHLPAGHAHHPRSHPLGGQGVAGLHGQVQLGTGGQQQGALFGPIGEIGQDVAPLRHAAFPGSLQGGKLLAGQQQGAGSVPVTQGFLPAFQCFPHVPRAVDPQAGYGPQCGEVFHGLVGRAVLAQADGIVGEDIDHLRVGNGGQADGGPHVIGEGEERARVGNHAAMEGQAVHDGAHAVLPDAIADILARELAG